MKKKVCKQQSYFSISLLKNVQSDLSNNILFKENPITTICWGFRLIGENKKPHICQLIEKT